MSSSHCNHNYGDMDLRKLFADEDRDKFHREMNEIRREFDEEFCVYGYKNDGNYFDLED